VGEFILTIKDVARYAGVSVSTVSRCLNGYPDISEETKKRVLHAMEVLNFVPSKTARMMTQKRTKIIGLTIPDIKDPFFAENASSAEKYLEEHGYSMFYGNMERSSEKLLHFLQLAREMRFDGLIITPDKWPEELLDALKKLPIPVVALRRRPPQCVGIPYVDNDHYKGAFKIMQFLTDLDHTKIAHIVLPTEIGAIRRKAYLDFCEVKGLEPRDVAIDHPANKLMDAQVNGYEAMKYILERYPDTTAVFASTDQLAIGALAYLQAKNIKVPDDISVAGVSNMDYSALPWFDLTTLALKKDEMGQCAAKMLLDMIEGREKHPQSVLVDSSLIVRGSTSKNNRK